MMITRGNRSNTIQDRKKLKGGDTLPNIEKVIEELQWFHDREGWDETIGGEPAIRKRKQIAADALALLKEQDAVEPKTGHWIYKKYDDMFMCSSCEKYSIRNDYPYCHWCGAKMKQEGR